MRQLKINNAITNRDSYALEKYLSEISKNQLLGIDDEIELSRRIRLGDDDALEKLVKANLRFVVSVAKQFQGQGLSLNDLINEGNLGLMRAATKFDESKGFKFITYAVWWIRQAMSQAIMEHAKVIRVPVNKLQNYQRINKTLQSLEQELQHEPELGAIAEKSGFSEDEVSNFLHSITQTVSTDSTYSPEDNYTLGDTLFDHDSLSPEEALVKKNIEQQLEQLIQSLNDREQEIIRYYYGLNGKDVHTLEEIGGIFGLTRERVRQIKENSLAKIKKRTEVSLLHYYPSR